MTTPINPTRLCCGQQHTKSSVACDDGRVMCQLCFHVVPQSELSIEVEYDDYGNEVEVKVDVCRTCASMEDYGV